MDNWILFKKDFKSKVRHLSQVTMLEQYSGFEIVPCETNSS